MWKGGRLIGKDGYVRVFAPDHPAAFRTGYIHEHRLVAEQKLGRPLLPEEVVHHIDRDGLNNHPDNLMVLSNSEHLKLHHAQGFRKKAKT